MAADAKHIRIPLVDNPTKAEKNCEECNRLIREEYAMLEANVDSADRNSSDYVTAANDARSLCSIHGRKS